MGGKEEKWVDIGVGRIRNILDRHFVANIRTLEQKIYDAGSYDQRPNPHTLTKARNILLEKEELLVFPKNDFLQTNLPLGEWYYLPGMSPETLRSRYSEQSDIAQVIHNPKVVQRTGKCLEIAIFKALEQQKDKLDLGYLGHFRG